MGKTTKKISKLKTVEGMQYEDLPLTPTKKPRRKVKPQAVPIRVIRPNGTVGTLKPRQNTTRRVRDHGQAVFYISFLALLGLMWLSGYYAGLPGDQRFESLLSAVVGLLVFNLALFLLPTKKGKK